MRAVQFSAYGTAPQLIETDTPRCPSDGVVVEVRATGLCRSDWHAWMGHETVPLPHIPGHEFAGVISAVGADVRAWSVGDRVTAPFVLGCGVCQYCLSGDAQVCPDQRQPGFTGPGAFAELVAVERADANLVALPDALDFVAAASLGCRFATAFRALTVHGNVAAGQWVAVHGCGGVGLSAVMIAVTLGAQVVAVDASPDALSRAASLGACRLIGTGTDTDTAAAVIAATGGGAHVSVDAIGDARTAAASVRSLRRRGRHVQVGLLHGDDATTALPMDRVIAFELQVHGSHGMAAHEYPAMLGLVVSGALRPDRLVGSVIGLDGAGAALTAMDRNTGGGMTVITP
ncbi:MAG: zinc-dependent alcohol dehydrogenase family protein [Candidatus Dormibacter sp.]